MASRKSSCALARQTTCISRRLFNTSHATRFLFSSYRTCPAAAAALSPSQPSPPRFLSTYSPLLKATETSNFDTNSSAASPGPESSGIPPPKSYTFEEIQDLTSSPSSNRILIDVREPSELLQTGRIPGAKSMPISSAPDGMFLSPEDFQDKFGFPRPGEQDEVIFYCKAGVRSRQAALLAGQARPMFGGKIANYNGSWLDWEKNGGKAEKEGEQG